MKRKKLKVAIITDNSDNNDVVAVIKGGKAEARRELRKWAKDADASLYDIEDRYSYDTRDVMDAPPARKVRHHHAQRVTRTKRR